MCPHVVCRQFGGAWTILVVFLDGIVGQMDGLVKVVQCVLLGAKTQVGVLVEPDGEGVPVSHQEPLPDVKLGVVDQQWPLCTNKIITVMDYVVFLRYLCQSATSTTYYPCCKENMCCSLIVHIAALL